MPSDLPSENDSAAQAARSPVNDFIGIGAVTNEMAELAAQAELQTEGIGGMAIGPTDWPLHIVWFSFLMQDRKVCLTRRASFSCSCGPSGANNIGIVWMVAYLS
jgi:hypothetical protein